MFVHIVYASLTKKLGSQLTTQLVRGFATDLIGTNAQNSTDIAR